MTDAQLVRLAGEVAATAPRKPLSQAVDLTSVSVMTTLASTIDDEAARVQVLTPLLQAVRDLTSKLEQVALNPQPEPPG